METPQPLFPHWMRGFLAVTAVYNLAWGLFINWYPDSFFQWVTKTDSAAPNVIQWQGKAVILMAIIYLASALYPRKFWYLILLGATTKTVGAVWFYTSILETEVGKTGWFHLIMNDAIWVPVLIAIGINAFKVKDLK